MTERRLRIATLAVPLSGNKGSASMLLGLMDAFSDVGIDASFDVFSYYPGPDAALASKLDNVRVFPGHPTDLVRLLPGLAAGSSSAPARALREADLVCLVGGTTFADSMLYKVPWNALTVLMGCVARRPIWMLPQTVGPLHRPANRLVARVALAGVECAYGRGRTSEAEIANVQPARARYAPDLSFAMHYPQFTHVRHLHPVLEELDALGAQSALAGITPNTIVARQCQLAGVDYLYELAAVARGLSARGYLPVIIPHSYRSSSAGSHNNDSHLCRALAAILEGEVRCVVVDMDADSRLLRSLVSRLDVLIASRFHSMVSALATGVVPVTIGWGTHKYREVLEDFDLAELYIDAATFRADRVLGKLDNVAGELAVQGKRLRARAHEMRGAVHGLVRAMSARIAGQMASAP